MTTTNGKPATMFDPEEVRRGLSVLMLPGGVLELRALEAVTDSDKWPHTATGFFDSADALVESLAHIRAAKGIYVTANPVKPALLARASNRIKKAGRGELTSDHDIAGRRFLLIDADAQRPAGISATDAEHEAAIERVKSIAIELHYNYGWPSPTIADSGNGAHLLYRIDLPAADDGLVEACLKVLAEKFSDDQVKVDTAVHNSARIWKLYGTLACKGDSTPDRPHRFAKVLSIADERGIVSRELLTSLAGEATPEPAKHDTPTTNGQAFDVDLFITRNSLDVCEPEPYQGGRRWIFKQSPCCEHHGDGPFLIQFSSGALAAGCHHESCNWTWHDLRAKYEPKRQGMPDLRPAEYRENPGLEKAISEPRYRIIAAAELDAAEYSQEYHIDNILAVGDFAMLGGPEKSLKTSLLVDMFIALAHGGHFLGTFPVNRPCRTLLFSGESGLPNLQDISRRVCRRAGYALADLENYHLSPDLPQLDNSADMSELERIFDQYRPDVAGIDPMFLCLGDTDADAGNMFIMGKLLRKFYAICQERKVTPIIAHHTLTMGLGTIPKLSNLAWSGFKQAAGQWILLNRRAEFEPGSGEHQMLMVTGGRAGHNLMRAVDIREGTREGLEGRYWQVEVSRMDEAREAAEERREQAKAAESERRLEADRRAIIKAIMAMPGREGTKTDLRDRSAVRTDRFNAALAGLLETRDIEPAMITKANNRIYSGFRIPQEEPKL